MTRTHWLVLVTVVLAVIVTGYGFKNHYDKKITDYTATVRESVAEQEIRVDGLLSGIKNGGFSNVSYIKVADCSRDSRIRFDELLSSLATLERGELLELNEIFNECAYYFSTVQSVAANQLSREVETYFGMLATLSVFEKQAKYKLENKNKWNDLTTMVGERAKLHTDLVSVQKNIVNELLAGKSSASAEVQAYVVNAKEVSENIVYLTQQIEVLSTELDKS